MTDTPDLREQVVEAIKGVTWRFDEKPASLDRIVDAVMGVLPQGFDRFVKTIELLRDRLADTTRQRDEFERRLTEAQLDVMERGQEIARLRREVEFEANGAGTFAGADAVAERGEFWAAFVAEDFGLDVDYEAGGVYVSLNHRRAARTEAWGDDVNVDYDADGTPTGVEVLRPPRVHPDSNGGAE